MLGLKMISHLNKSSSRNIHRNTKRTASADDENDKHKGTVRFSPLHISDVPDEALGLVAHFLSKPSVALFAVALTAPSSSWPKRYETQRQLRPTCRAVLSSFSWETIDFEDVERETAEKLADDDVFAVLACIDAGNSLKKLKISGCVNVVGGGLEPLRGSAVLEQLDLMSTGQYEDASDDDFNPPFREGRVVPILTSIVEAEGSSLKQLELPRSMRIEASNRLDFFLEKYNRHLESCGLECAKCNSVCMDTNQQENQWFVREKGNRLWGSQMFTCNRCTRSFCNGCRDIFGQTHVDHCENCEKRYCADCVFVNGCESCSRYICEGCAPNAGRCEGCGMFKCCRETCGHCGETRCNSCVEYHRCYGEGCGDGGKVYCGDCFGPGRYVGVCHRCREKLCSNCRFLNCVKDWKGACVACLNSIDTMSGLDEDNQKLRKEIEELKKELRIQRTSNVGHEQVLKTTDILG